jgi:hypothetical protein
VTIDDERISILPGQVKEQIRSCNIKGYPSFAPLESALPDGKIDSPKRGFRNGNNSDCGLPLQMPNEQNVPLKEQKHIYSYNPLSDK